MSKSPIHAGVSAFTTSLLASLGLIVAVELVVLLFWALVEIAISLWAAQDYKPLAFLFIVAGLLALGMPILRLVRPKLFGAASAATDNLNVISLALLDLAVILLAVFISGDHAITTPLLRFAKAMVGKLTS